MREETLMMNFPPYSLPDLAPADLPQLDLSHTGYHPPLAQQVHGLYGIDGFFAFTQQAQLPGGHFVTTQSYAPHLFDLSAALPGHEQYGATLTGNVQSESGFAVSAASAALAEPASPMGPPARPRKRKAPTLRADDWEPYKKRILDLHAIQGLPLPKVRQMIEEEYGFKAEYVAPVRVR
jgi:hypothetical protein